MVSTYVNRLAAMGKTTPVVYMHNNNDSIKQLIKQPNALMVCNLATPAIVETATKSHVF